jgi:hypothetical protein
MTVSQRVPAFVAMSMRAMRAIHMTSMFPARFEVHESIVDRHPVD